MRGHQHQSAIIHEITLSAAVRRRIRKQQLPWQSARPSAAGSQSPAPAAASDDRA